MNKQTILVTGGTGYIGSWVTKMLLNKGYKVRLTVRNSINKSKYEHLLHIAKTSNGQLEIYEADLLSEGSYDKAAQGSDAIIHMASPFTLRFKNSQKELIEPALKGTRNVLNAANKSTSVKKVILTSSVAAVYGDTADMKELGLVEFSEDDFNYSSNEVHQPYSYSKVLAEREAWYISYQQSQWQLVVINPSFVMGPSLSPHSNSESLQFMKDLLGGKFFMGAPKLNFGFVDVRDVATAHILALVTNQAKGRYILAERLISMFEFSKIIKKYYKNKYKLPIMETPKFIIYLIGSLFGLSSKFIKRNIGHDLKLNTKKSKEQLKLKYTPLEQTVQDMIAQIA